MILYHYTAREYLDAITREGLTKGDVPLSPNTGVNAVWLTTDPDAGHHGLSISEETREALRKEIKFRHGRDFPEGIKPLNKRAVRIKVVIPSSDRALKAWLPYARKRLEPRWLQTLNETGGGKANAQTWWLYFGTITPNQFAAVDILEHRT